MLARGSNGSVSGQRRVRVQLTRHSCAAQYYIRIGFIPPPSEGTAPPPPSRANTHDIGRVKGGRGLEPLGSPPSRAEEGGEAKKEEASTSMMFDMDFA